MGPNGKDTGQGDLRLELLNGSEVRGPHNSGMRDPLEVVFDFTGLQRPGLCELALILTARLQSGPDERVWVRALPDASWSVLHALGLAHLFHVLPGPGKILN